MISSDKHGLLVLHDQLGQKFGIVGIRFYQCFVGYYIKHWGDNENEGGKNVANITNLLPIMKTQRKFARKTFFYQSKMFESVLH